MTADLAKPLLEEAKQQGNHKYLICSMAAPPLDFRRDSRCEKSSCPPMVLQCFILTVAVSVAHWETRMPRTSFSKGELTLASLI